MPELVSAWIGALSKRRRALLSLNQDIDHLRLAPEAIKPDDDPILKTLDARREKLEQVRARLMQHNFTGFVLVVIPERLPIEETARAAEVLRESNVNVCGVVVNRVLPDDLEGDFYKSRRKQEQIYVEEIKQRFSGYPSRGCRNWPPTSTAWTTWSGSARCSCANRNRQSNGRRRSVLAAEPEQRNLRAVTLVEIATTA